MRPFANASRPATRSRAGWLSILVVAALAPSLATAQQHLGGGKQPVTGKAERLAIQELDDKVIVALGADVLFDFDRAELKAAAEPTLRQVAELAERYPDGQVLVEGHTDGVGDAAYNLGLSERRAAAVKTWLVDKGAIAASRIETRGWGMTRPVAPNTRPDGSDDPAGRRRNRRVEITIFKH